MTQYDGVLRCKSIIRDFSSPSFLHSTQIQVLNAHKSVFPTDRMCQLEMKVFALICCFLVQPCQCEPCPLSMVRPILFPCKRFPCPAYRCCILLEKERGFPVVSVRRCEKLRESEVIADAFTCSCQNFVFCRLTDEIKIDVPECIPLDGDDFDRSLDAAAFEIAVLLRTDLDGISFQELPSCLFQRIRFILSHLLERGRCCAHLLFQISEKEFVGTVNPLRDVLHRLCTDFFQVGKPGDLAKEIPVFVLTGSDGVLRGAPGGHPDTAAGSKCCIIVTPLVRGRMATVCKKVVTVTTPGDCVDVLVTDYGIAVNPARRDLIACLDAAGIAHTTIEALQEKAYSLVGEPDELEWEDPVIAVLEARDGTILDVVRKIKPLVL